MMVWCGVVVTSLGELEPIMKEFGTLQSSLDQLEELQMDVALLKSGRDGT